MRRHIIRSSSTADDSPNISPSSMAPTLLLIFDEKKNANFISNDTADSSYSANDADCTTAV